MTDVGREVGRPSLVLGIGDGVLSGFEWVGHRDRTSRIKLVVYRGRYRGVLV